jgi:hypothetical protein
MACEGCVWGDSRRQRSRRARCTPLLVFYAAAVRARAQRAWSMSMSVLLRVSNPGAAGGSGLVSVWGLEGIRLGRDV